MLVQDLLNAGWYLVIGSISLTQGRLCGSDNCKGPSIIRVVGHCFFLHVTQSQTSNGLPISLNLLSYQLLIILRGIEILFDILLDQSNVIHLLENEIEVFRHLFPMALVIIRVLRHGVEYELGLLRWFGWSRGDYIGNRNLKLVEQSVW